MFCSTIIPTIGRTELSRAVWSVLNQAFPIDEFEIIVVNDSGRPLPDEDWQQSPQVRVVTTHQRERCVARNTGAAMARGTFLHFLDDDDWLLPDALAAFQRLTQTTLAGWLYGVTQLVDRDNEPIIHLRHGITGNAFVQSMSGEWIPLQGSLIKAKNFFDVGGFNLAVTGSEDIDLLRRFSLKFEVAFAPETVACVGMGVQNSSTDYGGAASLARRAREDILAQPGVFGRLSASAEDVGSCANWRGRMTRLYLTSMVWNLKNRRFFAALSRGTAAVASLFLSAKYFFAGKFWQSIFTAYDSETFLRGFSDAGKDVGRRNLKKVSF